MRRPAAGLAAAALLLAACATAPPPPPAPAPAAQAPAPPPPPPPPELALPEAFRSDDLVLAFARPGETAATLAARHLGDAGLAWLVEDYTGKPSFEAGEAVLFPARPWNPAGVTPDGYQIVPILVYHNLGPQPKGRLVLGARAFEEQMRYLVDHGYRVVAMRDFVEFVAGRRQLPRRAVVLTFDDGYRAFKEHAYPVLRALGLTATLFVYTDYVGAGRNALSWAELRELAAEGFEVHAHSKTHGDLRRARGESDQAFAQRMRAELVDPLRLFERHLGQATRLLAYPYGRADDEVVRHAREAGYIAAFTVRRQGSPSFVEPLRVHRSQIYSEMTLEEFARNLDVWHEEDLR